MTKAKLVILLSVVLTLFMVFLISGCDTDTEENLTLEIDVDGSGEVSGSGTYPEGEEVTVEATPKKKSEFIGWHKDGEKVSSDSNYHFEIHQGTQLKAVFEDKENNNEDTEEYFTLDLNKEGVGIIFGSGTYPKGKEVTARVREFERHEFIGWYKDGEKVSSDSRYRFEIHQDTRLKAVFKDTENGEKIKEKYGEDVVYFKCNVLEEVIKNKLNIEGKVKKEDMKKVEGILPQDMIPHESDDPKVPIKKIISFEGLQYAKNLEKMHFSFVADDLSPLSELDNLRVINTRRSGYLKDLTPISNLDNLEILHIDYSSVEDLSPVSELGSLKELRITTSSEINDISPLSNLKQLEILDLGDCFDSVRTPSTYELSSLSGLEENLKKLRLDGNYIKDKSYLANFTNLEVLELMGCGLNDFSFLTGLKDIKSLKRVDLVHNKLDDKAMEYIKELKKEGIEVIYTSR